MLRVAYSLLSLALFDRLAKAAKPLIRKMTRLAVKSLVHKDKARTRYRDSCHAKGDTQLLYSASIRSA